MTRKLQAVRLQLNDGKSYLFFGPAVLPLDNAVRVIEFIDFSNQFEYESSLSLNDLWLLVQNGGVTH